jgi:predicted nucleic acid-binding protein
MKLVDTSAWVEFLRRKGDPAVKQAVARLLQADLAAYTCPVRFELLSGVKPEEETYLDQAFAFSHHLPFKRQDWDEAARLERRFRANGLTIPRNDLFVATVAIRTRSPVVCRDSHFDAMGQVVGGKLAVEQV